MMHYLGEKIAVEDIIEISGKFQILNVNYVTVCTQMRLPDSNCIVVM